MARKTQKRIKRGDLVKIKPKILHSGVWGAQEIRQDSCRHYSHFRHNSIFIILKNYSAEWENGFKAYSEVLDTRTLKKHSIPRVVLKKII